MDKRKKILSVIGASSVMILLVFDTTTAKNGASEGIELCLNVIIPSLFPFFVITSYLNSTLLGLKIPCSTIVGRLLSIPKGCESLLIIGLIGGYPVGAQLIADSYNKRILTQRTARILLGYCSNAGPAFIFGVAGMLFTSKFVVVTLWLIHMLSAILTGYLLPRPKDSEAVTIKESQSSIIQSLRKSISVCACVCGWIVIFKIILAYIDKFPIHKQNSALFTVIKGLLELSNGCVLLQNIESEPTRFIIASVLLGFGGLCVALQTKSLTSGIGMGLYFPGKIMQTYMSFILSILILPVIFPYVTIPFQTQCFILLSSVPILYSLKVYCKKRCGNFEKNHV